jgi:hypothetical protein
MQEACKDDAMFIVWYLPCRTVGVDFAFVPQNDRLICTHGTLDCCDAKKGNSDYYLIIIKRCDKMTQM